MGHLGPDLLGPDWDPDEAVRRLAADPDREIGQALLDQRNLAGIGNLYQAEVLLPAGRLPVDAGRATSTSRRSSTGPTGCSTATRTTCGRPRPACSVAAGTLGLRTQGRPCLRCGTPVATRRAGRGAVPADRVLVPAAASPARHRSRSGRRGAPSGPPGRHPLPPLIRGLHGCQSVRLSHAADTSGQERQDADAAPFRALAVGPCPPVETSHDPTCCLSW